MWGSGRTRVGVVAAAVGVALGALLAGRALQPPPVSAAYCDDYPFLCSTLTIDPSGNGGGRVTTADGFIDCRWNGAAKSGTCSKRYVEDAQGAVTVTLTYEADQGSYLCLGVILPDCHADSYTHDVTFGGDHTDRVAFRIEDCSQVPDTWCYTLTFATSGNGAGHIETGDGFMDCNYAAGSATGTCSHEYFVGPEGGTVTVRVDASANADSVVCEDNLCGATRGFTQGFSGNYQLAFQFKLKTYAVTVVRAGSGTGRIVSTPTGIDCGSTCVKTFTHGDEVTLAAVPAAGSSFSNWSGACAGQDAACDLTVTGASTSTATFLVAGTTAPPGPTAGPGTTAQPTGQTAAPGSTSEPGASPSTGVPSEPPASGTAASLEPNATAPHGAGASGAPTQDPSGVGQPANERGPDTTLLALAILGAAVIVAIGLAIGLRGRRTRSEDPPAG